MGSFAIRRPEQVGLILRAFAQLDEIRWRDSKNYNIINYCSEDLTAGEKLLTHWLSYVADRQMSFMRIWTLGGYVISHLVRAFERSGRSAEALAEEYVGRNEENGGGIVLQCALDGPNRRLELQGITKGPVRFASRYIPEDVFVMFRTLALLEKTGRRQLAGFLGLFICDGAGVGENIERMAAALNGLTYSAGRAVSAGQLESRLRELWATVDVDAEAIVQDPARWIAEQQRRFRRFSKKRLWCSVRDYLKSPEFNPVFVRALADAGVSNAHRWERTSKELKQALDRLELPGDVWNNNEVFAKGLFAPFLENKPKTWDMPRTVREMYRLMERTLGGTFYPEQLDVTFDFVPRMCEREMCGVCLFGGGVRKLCHGQRGLLCAVPLVACGYEHACEAEGCCFKNETAEGSCRHWQEVVAD